MNRYYVGYKDEQCKIGEVFGWDLKHEPTPEETGYLYISVAHETLESAEEEANS